MTSERKRVSKTAVTLRTLQVFPTPDLDGTIRLRCLSFAATDRGELVADPLEETAQALHELVLPFCQLLTLALLGLPFAHQRS